MLRLAWISLFVIAAMFWMDIPAFGAPQPQGAKIDLSRGVTFERYLTTGDSAQMKSALERVSSLALSDHFLAFVRGIDIPLVLAVYTELWCPDCARTTPFVHAISQANPLIKAVYFPRDELGRVFMRAQTGRSSIPTIFVTDKGGLVAGDVYVEYPERVQALIADASEDAARHKNDLRSGLYDEEIENDLRKLMESAIKELKER
ncbi:MAG: thioredoxin family protein [Synergistaceae bacterium]|jgi:glutaredoxin|nr:thioredoxin family protein [Synergistaceae bacterium]